LATIDSGSSEGRGVANTRRQPRSQLAVALEYLFEVDGLGSVELREHRIFVRQDEGEALAEGRRVDEVAHADTHTADLVGEAGAHAASGGTDGGRTAQLLVQLVDHGVVGHDHVRPVANEEALGTYPTRFQRIDLREQDIRIDGNTVADDAGLVGIEDAG